MYYVQKCLICGCAYIGPKFEKWCPACMGPMSEDLNPRNYNEQGDHADD